MKTFHFLPWLGCALLTLALSACHDDDPPALMPTLPVNGGDAVKEIVHNGNLPDCCDWAFTYSSGRLVAATGTSILNGESVTSVFNLGYEPQSVSMYGQGKEAYTLTLNGDRLINRISRTEIVDGARDYRLMTRQMVKSILSLKEVSRFSKGIFSWVGYRTKWLEYENIQRVAGETKWSFWKLLLYSIDGIIGFSTAPLAIASVVGVLFCLIAFILILFFFIKTIIWGDPVAGFPATICIILLLGGIQLFCVGILGQYLSKTYLETKKRPIYIARDIQGKDG